MTSKREEQRIVRLVSTSLFDIIMFLETDIDVYKGSDRFERIQLLDCGMKRDWTCRDRPHIVL